MKALVEFYLFLASVLPFDLPVMNGEVGEIFKSEDHPNAVFVIENYFYDCPYCHQNAPNVDALAEHFSNNPRVIVLDVGVDKKDSQYSAWISKHQPNHLVLKDANRELAKKLGTSGYPSAYVIDCQGKIVKKVTGAWSNSSKEKMKEAVNQALHLECPQEDMLTAPTL